MKIFRLKFIGIISFLILCQCVGPEEYTDGLLENLPAIVNTKNAFTLTLKSASYTFEEEYDLNLDVGIGKKLVTTLAVTNVKSSNQDTFLEIISSDTVVYTLENKIVVNETVIDSGKTNLPIKVNLIGAGYTGNISLVIACSNTSG